MLCSVLLSLTGQHTIPPATFVKVYFHGTQRSSQSYELWPQHEEKLKQGNLNFSLIFSMFYRLAFLLLETRGEFYVETLFSMHVNR